MLVLALAASALADWPLGTEIPNAVTADVTPEGFDAITALIPGLVPPSVAIPDYHLHDEYSVWGATVYEYQVDVTNGTAYITVDSVSITPGTDVLNLDARVTIQVNTPSDPIDLYAYGDAVGISISQDCDVWSDPITFDLQAAIQLTLLPDGTIDATVPPLALAYNLDSSDVHIDNCLVGDINTVLNWFGIDVVQILIDQVTPQIDQVVADLAPTIESTLEDAFSGIGTISGSIDVVGAPLDYSLRPSELTIAPDGMRVGLSASFDTTPNACVAKYGITESLATPGTPPAIGAYPNTLGYTPHIAVAADDDWINQALFALWESGILCQQIDSAAADSLGLPIPIDTSLLTLLAPGVFDDLFPETEPLTIAISPTLPPTGSPQGAHDVNISVDGLEVDFFGGLDGRQARLVGMDLAAEAGIDLDFDQTTGNLGVGVSLDGDTLTPTVAYNELTPDSNAVIESSFDGLFDSLVGPMITGLVGDIAFPIPAFNGFGVTALDVAPTGNLDVNPTGASGDRLGVFATLGMVSYPASGCDASSGCSGTTGCATSPTGAGATALLGAIVALRRRQRR